VPLKDLLSALIVIIAWGMNFVVIKVGLSELPPLLLGALRFAFVAFPAVFFVRRPAIPWRTIVLYGFTISLGQFVFLFLAMSLGMPAGLASLVLQSQALFTVLIAALFLGERLRWNNLAGLAVAAAGLAMVQAGAETGSMTLIGFMLTLAAALSWATGNIVVKGAGTVDMLGLVVWGALIPPLPFLALSLLYEGPALIFNSVAHVTWAGVLAVFYLAGVATIIGYSLWGRLLSRHPAGKVAPLSLLIPVIGLISSALLLDEHLASVQWYGGAVVMLGLAINLFGARLLAVLPVQRGTLR